MEGIMKNTIFLISLAGSLCLFSCERKSDTNETRNSNTNISDNDREEDITDDTGSGTIGAGAGSTGSGTGTTGSSGIPDSDHQLDTIEVDKAVNQPIDDQKEDTKSERGSLRHN
jgi:hypothetical protein